MNTNNSPTLSVFHHLTPETIINLVEAGFGSRCTNLCRPLNSYINRVYELQSEDGGGLIIKFYRPGRWSRAAIQDEHDFLLELADQEIPVIAPYKLQSGETIGTHGTVHFAVFPKKGGRSYDEYSDEQWLELGRLMGRVHAVGAGKTARDRIVMLPEHSTRQQVDFLLQGNFMPDDLGGRFKKTAETLIAAITPLFHNVEIIRIHGDCHFSNLIYRPGESFYLIDFDDMVMGPPVQDFWMLLPGHLNEAYVEVDLFLEGYETFNGFDRRTLKLIEPLRAMRYIHYIAWCAHQFKEDGESPVAPEFGSRHYWQQEINDLAEQLERIREVT